MIFSQEETDCIELLKAHRIQAEMQAVGMAAAYANAIVRPQLQRMLAAAGIVADYRLNYLIYGKPFYSYTFYKESEYMAAIRSDDEDDDYDYDDDEADDGRGRWPDPLKHEDIPDAIIAMMDAPLCFGLRVRDLVRILPNAVSIAHKEQFPEPRIEFSWRRRGPDEIDGQENNGGLQNPFV